MDADIYLLGVNFLFCCFSPAHASARAQNWKVQKSKQEEGEDGK